MRSVPPAIASSRTLTALTLGLVLAALMSGWLQIEWVVTLIKIALTVLIVSTLAPLVRNSNRKP